MTSRTTDSPSARHYDVVLYGATGFVGRQTVAYFANLPAVVRKNLRWAIAGRSESKLQEVKAACGAGAEDVNVIVADALDAAAINALAKSTAVVLSTAGPFAIFGSELLAACARFVATASCRVRSSTRRSRSSAAASASSRAAIRSPKLDAPARAAITAFTPSSPAISARTIAGMPVPSVDAFSARPTMTMGIVQRIIVRVMMCSVAQISAEPAQNKSPIIGAGGGANASAA